MKQFSIKTFVNLKTALLFTLFMAIFASAFVFTNKNEATADTLLADKVLHAKDVAGFEIQTWDHDEKIVMSDLSHPLNNAVGKPEASDPVIQEQIMAYQEGYQTSAVMRWQDQPVMVGNYVYRYPSPEQAIQAQKAITGQYLSNKQSQALETFNQDNMQGQSLFIMGDENDAVYWFVGVRQDMVIMLVVDSMSVATSKGSFDILLDSLLLKQK